MVDNAFFLKLNNINRQIYLNLTNNAFVNTKVNLHVENYFNLQYFINSFRFPLPSKLCKQKNVENKIL